MGEIDRNGFDDSTHSFSENRTERKLYRELNLGATDDTECSEVYSTSKTQGLTSIIRLLYVYTHCGSYETMEVTHYRAFQGAQRKQVILLGCSKPGLCIAKARTPRYCTYLHGTYAQFVFQHIDVNTMQTLSLKWHAHKVLLHNRFTRTYVHHSDTFISIFVHAINTNLPVRSAVYLAYQYLRLDVNKVVPEILCAI